MREDQRLLMYRARQAALGKSICYRDWYGVKMIDFGQKKDVEILARRFAGKGNHKR